MQAVLSTCRIIEWPRRFCFKPRKGRRRARNSSKVLWVIERSRREGGQRRVEAKNGMREVGEKNPIEAAPGSGEKPLLVWPDSVRYWFGPAASEKKCNATKGGSEMRRGIGVKSEKCKRARVQKHNSRVRYGLGGR